MKAATSLRAGVASDRGLRRSNNEDRVFVDEALGIFLVVDGLGGQAAGEQAAEVATEVISAQLRASEGEPRERIVRAITEANNEIFRRAQTRDEWRGMACVLTLAVSHGEQVTVGHVGDTRMYLAWDGKLRKLTPDHAPVGEREDLGELTEREAMAHPRRHEVFRDVGSRPRTGEEEDFIEVRSFPLRADAALLLCTDGLTDAVTSAEISAVIETYDGDPKRVAERLVEAANRTGGNDNVSAVFVAGPEFLGMESSTMQDARRRHGTTRPRRARWRRRALAERAAWLAAGIGLGVVLWHGGSEVMRKVRAATVDPSDPRAIQRAMSAARPGDTIVAPPGQYTGPIELKEGVTLRSAEPGGAVIRGGDAGFVARGLRSGRLSGFRVTGDAGALMAAGVVIDNSSIAVDDMEITGAGGCGVRVEGSSRPVLRANYIHDNAGCGVWIGGDSTPRLAGNRISGNGVEAKGFGVEIHPPAHPVLENNIFAGNGRTGFGEIEAAYAAQLREKNVTDGGGSGEGR